MEYYNLQGKENFESYYRNKMNALLLNPEITTYLDKYKIDINNNSDFSLFPGYDKNKFRNVTTFNNVNQLKSDLSQPTKKAKVSKEQMKESISKKVKEVDLNLKKIESKVSNEIVNQMQNFEARKRGMKVRAKQVSKSPAKELSIEVDKSSMKSSEVSFEAGLGTPTKKIPTRRRGSSIGHTAMLKEIEEFVDKNLKEMNAALEEIKTSYSAEIQDANDNGFPDIAESLEEDMKGELENLTAQFEEQRAKEVEAIKEKYRKKGNIVVSEDN